MTRLAIGREPCLLMVRVSGLVVVGLVAIDTVSGSPCVPTIGMTQTAIGGLMLPVQRPNQVVIQRRPSPTIGGCAMARLAVGRESCLLMVRVSGLVEIGLVAIDTVSVCAGEPAVGMTQAAVHCTVPATEWKDTVVIQSCIGPARSRCAVAGLTVGRESRLLMVRIGRPLVIRTMAIDTVCGCAGEPPVGMTQTAFGCPVLSVQRPDQAVLERCPLPTVRRCSVTNRTVVGKSSPLMIWIGSPQIVLLMTSRTF